MSYLCIYSRCEVIVARKRPKSWTAPCHEVCTEALVHSAFAFPGQQRDFSNGEQPHILLSDYKVAQFLEQMQDPMEINTRRPCHPRDSFMQVLRRSLNIYYLFVSAR
jgi:hypothetical protein